MLYCNTRVQGGFAAEVFAGVAALTYGLRTMGVPTLYPWDILYGEAFDVLTHGWILLDLVSCGIISYLHFALPCQSLTGARDPMLRSSEFLFGLPGLSVKDAKMVDEANSLISWVLEMCLALITAGGYFSLENPIGSLLWLFPDVIELYHSTGVIFTGTSFSRFGARVTKPLGLLHNLPTLHLLDNFDGFIPGPKAVLRGLVEWHASWCSKHASYRPTHR